MFVRCQQAQEIIFDRVSHRTYGIMVIHMCTHHATSASFTLIVDYYIMNKQITF